MVNSVVRAKECPIKGCRFRYSRSIVGWAKHVLTPGNHPNWYVPGEPWEATLERYRHEFSAFFDDAAYSRAPVIRAPVEGSYLTRNAAVIQRELLERLSKCVAALQELQRGISEMGPAGATRAANDVANHIPPS